jgi:transcriptional regulator with XRE-family HTH domain
MASDSFKEFLKNLGSVIKQTRKEKGLTQGELGGKLGKPQSTIARLESAVMNDTHIGLIYEICEELGIDITQVISDAVGTTKAQEPVSADDIDGRWEKIAYALNSLNEKDRI